MHGETVASSYRRSRGGCATARHGDGATSPSAAPVMPGCAGTLPAASTFLSTRSRVACGHKRVEKSLDAAGTSARATERAAGCSGLWRASLIAMGRFGLVLVVCLIASAQTASLSGVVRSADGSALANAVLSDGHSSVQANSDGTFTFA